MSFHRLAVLWCGLFVMALVLVNKEQQSHLRGLGVKKAQADAAATALMAEQPGDGDKVAAGQPEWRGAPDMDTMRVVPAARGVSGPPGLKVEGQLLTPGGFGAMPFASGVVSTP